MENGKKKKRLTDRFETTPANVYNLSRIMYQTIKHKVSNFLSDESGPTAVEYAVMLAMILAICLTAIATLGTASLDMWNGNSSDIDTFLK